MYCAQCGEYNPDDNHYCENCGAFLDAQKILEIRLRDKEHNLEFSILLTPYVIGSSRSGVHGYINSRAVSRRHAQITCNGGEFYIMDLNSTNGTYKDGGKITPGTRVMLENGMKIGIANYSFTVTKPE